MEEQNLSNSKQAILDAAQELLVQYGYTGLSMRELALASGLAKATIYHYFQDKEEIFRQVMERDMRLVHDHIQAAVDQQTTPLDKLRAFIHTYFTLLNERRTTILGIMRELGKNQELFREMICAHRHAHLTPLIKIIQQGIDEGSFRPMNVEYTTYSLLGMINALAVLPAFTYTVPPEAIDIDEAATHILQLVLHGIQVA